MYVCIEKIFLKEFSKFNGSFDRVLVAQCVRLFATPWTVSHQAPLSIGFSRQDILKWAAIPSSKGSSQPRD